MPENENKKLKMGIRKDSELYNFIVNAYKTSLKYMEELGVPQDVEMYSKIYDGKIWEVLGSSARSKYLSKVKTGLEFDTIETGLVIATGKDPMPEVTAQIGVDSEEWLEIKAIQEKAVAEQNEELMEQAVAQMDALQEKLISYANQVQQWLIDDWKATNMRIKNKELYREKAKTGDGFIKTVFDAEKDEIKDVICDNFTICPAPNVPSIPCHAERGEPFVYAPVMTVEKAEKMLGIKGLSEAAIGVQGSDKKFKFKNKFTERILALANAFVGGASKRRDQVIILECWMPDDKSMVEATDFDYDEESNQRIPDETTESGYKEKKVQRKRFASGFKVATVILGHKDWIVAEEENLYQDGRPPFFQNKNYPQANVFHGVPELKNLIDIIMKINSLLSSAVDNIKLTGNPKLEISRNTKTLSGGPVNTRSAQILVSETGSSARFIPPPPLGGDYKYLVESFMEILNRVSHLADAVRGASQYSGESGRKIRELRTAAMGLFQSKLDEQIAFSQEYFKFRVHLLQNFKKTPILQRVQDVDEKDSFEEFLPALGKDWNLNVSVSSDSILPKDVMGDFEEKLELFDRRDEFNVPGCSIQDVIRSAPSIDNKQTLIENYEKNREAAEQRQQLELNTESFNNIADQLNKLLETKVDAMGESQDVVENRNQLIAELVDILSESPELIKSQKFAALPEQVQTALVNGLTQVLRQQNAPQLLQEG